MGLNATQVEMSQRNKPVKTVVETPKSKSKTVQKLNKLVEDMTFNNL